jgi:hypothetical protein
MSSPPDTPHDFKKGQLVIWNKQGLAALVDVNCYGWRAINADELDRWHKSEDSRGIDSAGETKLPPKTVYIKLEEDRVYEVIRARCSSWLSFQQITKCAEIFCFATGERFFIQRRLLRHV